MWRPILAALIVSVLLSSAQAQPAPSEQESYRAYRAAFDRGDMAAAEAPAAAALAASQAQDGDGGHTGVLALNLALVRLWLGRPAEAREPAALALRIAQANGQTSGVDPVLAQLALGRAELPSSPSQASAELLSALALASNRTDLHEQAYAAAVALGQWAESANKLDVARTAWAAAAIHADGAPSDHVLMRATALKNQGSAILRDAVDGRRRSATRDSEAAEAFRVLNTASDLLRLQANQPTPDNRMSPVQTVFAQSLAWAGIASISGGPGVAAQTPPPGVCKPQIRLRDGSAEFYRYYPPAAFTNDIQGVAVLRILIPTPNGAPQIDVVAAIPGRIFDEAANRIAQNSVVSPSPESVPNCTMPPVYFVPLTFRVGTR